MGAARPGSTLPPQGGKSGVQRPTLPPQGAKGGGAPMPPQPQSPYTPIGSQPQMPPQGEGLGMGGVAGKGNAPVQPTVPPQGGKTPLTPDQIAALGSQSQMPPQGGKGGVQPQMPPQGGKGGVQPQTLQPGAQIFNGTVTPNTIGPNGLPVGGTMPRPVPQVMPRPMPQVMPRGLAGLRGLRGLRGRR